jgi:Fic family protein
MIYATPQITPDLKNRLDELDALRTELHDEVSQPGPWLGTLRRLVRASSVESSTSIEGFHVDQSDAVALVSGEEQPDPDDESRMAVACYARAMDHVGVMASDPVFRWLDRVILDLHFDACYFQRDKSPGLWRTGPILVTKTGGGILYRGPAGEDVVGLMDEVVAWLEEGDLNAHVVVRAAMAHLHLVSVHPFRDGNGRIARIVQSLVLAREGLLSPEFSSIEQYLGEHTPDYYGALQEAQGGMYQPERDASKWVRFCVEAHLEQAQQRLEQIREAAARWSFLESLVDARGWPDRLVIALEQGLAGGSDRASYGEEADISPATASGDFRRLLDGDLLVQRGRGRNIRYEASPAFRERVAQAVNAQLSDTETPRDLREARARSVATTG